MTDFGTPELKQHCKLEITPRDISNGGRIVTVGLRNKTPDLLERLYDQGYLRALWEKQSAADRRVDNGRSFQALYAEFKSHGSDPAAASNEIRQMLTLEGHVGSERDIAETVYYRTLHLMGAAGRVARAVCIEGQVCGVSDRQIQLALDALPKAVEQARGDVLQSLHDLS